MSLQIIKYPNEILRKKCEKIEKKDKEVKKMLLEMYHFVSDPKNEAAGLSLPQIGINKCGFVYWRGNKVEIVINPKILRWNHDLVSVPESCLSIDGITGRVNRRSEILVTYRNLHWEKKKVTLKNLDAIVFQHEFDHLRGVLFIDYLKNEEN